MVVVRKVINDTLSNNGIIISTNNNDLKIPKKKHINPSVLYPTCASSIIFVHHHSYIEYGSLCMAANSDGKKKVTAHQSSSRDVGGIHTHRYLTHLSGSVAERLSHGDVTHSWRTGGLPIIQCLSSLGSPGKKRQPGTNKIYY